jgi:hypothetical protein
MDFVKYERLEKRANAGEMSRAESEQKAQEYAAEIIPLYGITYSQYVEDLFKRDTDATAILSPLHRRIGQALRDAPNVPRPKASDLYWQRIRATAVRKSGRFGAERIAKELESGESDDSAGLLSEIATAVEAYLRTDEGREAHRRYNAMRERELVEEL